MPKNTSALAASEMIGKDVVNTDGKDIGQIKEVMLDNNYGKVAYAVLQFGGFMGLGDKYFAIPWEALGFDSDDDNFVLNVEKEVLEEAEGFDKDNWPDMANYEWSGTMYDHYGYDHYWS